MDSNKRSKEGLSMAKEINKQEKEVHEITAAHFQGPLPPPSLLKEYDAYCRDLPNESLLH